MLDFEDKRWTELLGGYRVAYDPRPALTRLEAGRNMDGVWSELWNGLHHQGDVDTASYAAVPHLVRIHRARDVPDWNTYALLGVIAIASRAPRNPAIPMWLREGYDTAWAEIVGLAVHDLARSSEVLLTRSALGVIALARNLARLGEAALRFDEDELDEMIAHYEAGGEPLAEG